MAPIYIISPLDAFEVTPYFYFGMPILGDLLKVFSITNLTFYGIMVMITIFSLHMMVLRETKLLPGRWGIGLESGFASIHIIVKEQIGTVNEKYIPIIYGLFSFLLAANLIGNIPYSFTITTSAIVAIGTSFAIFLGVTILGLYKHGFKFFSFFVPNGTPLPIVFILVFIELISYVARAFSLGVRLFANMVAGHTLLIILSGFLLPMTMASLPLFLLSFVPLAVFTTLLGLELAVSFIQAYVISILTSIYLKDAIELH